MNNNNLKYFAKNTITRYTNTMGFFQELGGFIDEVKILREDIDETKHAVISSITDDVAMVSTTISDTANSISTTTTQISDDIKKSTQLPTE